MKQFEKELCRWLRDAARELQLTKREALVLEVAPSCDTLVELGRWLDVSPQQAKNIMRRLIRRINQRIKTMAREENKTVDRHPIDFSTLEPRLRNAILSMPVRPKYWEDVCFCGEGLMRRGVGRDTYLKVMEIAQGHCGPEFR